MTASRRTARTRGTPEIVELASDTETSTGDNGTAPPADLDPILPDPGHIDILGMPCTVRRLKTRELLLAVRVVTAGIGAGIMRLDLTLPRDELLPMLAGVLFNAIPEAPDEFVDLLTAVIDVRGKDHKPAIAEIMHNPPIGVAVDVLTAIVEQEKDEISELLGKVLQLLGFQKALAKTTAVT